MSKQFVVISLGEQRYCMPIELVSGIIESFDLTKVPNSLPYVVGVSNVRGEILPVISLKNLFNIEDSLEIKKKLMSVTISSQNIGLLVDSASNVITVDEDHLSDMPPVLNKKDKNYFNMVANIDEALAIVINPFALFSEKEQIELQKISEK